MLRGNFAGAVAGVASEKQSPPEQGRVFPAIQPACPPRSRREQGFPLKPNPLCSDPQSRATPPPSSRAFPGDARFIHLPRGLHSAPSCLSASD